jgi:hypothetical protein
MRWLIFTSVGDPEPDPDPHVFGPSGSPDPLVSGTEPDPAPDPSLKFVERFEKILAK